MVSQLGSRVEEFVRTIFPFREGAERKRECTLAIVGELKPIRREKSAEGDTDLKFLSVEDRGSSAGLLHSGKVFRLLPRNPETRGREKKND
jgi:hypothetical protein